MRNILTGSAIALMAVIAVQAQTPQTQPDPKQSVTVTGCVQSQTDVLKSAPVTGQVGMGDEFVLTNSMVRTATAAPTATPPDEPTKPEPTGTSGGVGKVYRVTGDQEASLKAQVGQKVEITGTFKNEADARRELGAIGTSGKPPATAGEPSATNTPEITISTIRPMGACGG
jgi:hypothetical protein